MVLLYQGMVTGARGKRAIFLLGIEEKTTLFSLSNTLIVKPAAVTLDVSTLHSKNIGVFITSNVCADGDKSVGL